MILFILRGAFIVLVVAVTALYLLTHQAAAGVGFAVFILIMVIALGLAVSVIALDVSTQEKRLSAVSGVFLGLIAGLLAAYALSFVVDLFGVLTAPEGEEASEAYFNLLEGVKVVIGLVTCYIGISLVLQTKDDFRFVIPYVEFTKQIRGNRPILLDSSVIVDGRILDIIETGTIQGTIVVPKFILNELQTIADSADKLRRARGRRGLDVLRKLQESPVVEVVIDDAETEGATVDQQLINRTDQMQGRVMTNDFNLNKVAKLRGVEVINLNDLAKAMRPVVLPGEHLTVKLVKPGEGPAQGVGYLDDGTMVVVEEGRRHIGEDVQLVVTSTLQTSAGRMIFGRFEGSEANEADPAQASEPSRESDGVASDGQHDQQAAQAKHDKAPPSEHAQPGEREARHEPASHTTTGQDEGPSSPRTRPRPGRNPRRAR